MKEALKRLVLPRLYVILDQSLLSLPETEVVRQLADAGVRLLQYRRKAASARALLDSAKRLSPLLNARSVTFIVNDRADVAALCGATGVHVGQDDLSVEDARTVAGTHALVGVSTHNLEQFQQAAATSADYIAAGPVFSTTSKTKPDPVVGMEFIRQVRPLTEKPIVAIGGITLDRAAEAIHAGADSVAVISDILRAPNPAQRAREFLEVLDAANHKAAV